MKTVSRTASFVTTEAATGSDLLVAVLVYGWYGKRKIDTIQIDAPRLRRRSEECLSTICFLDFFCQPASSPTSILHGKLPVCRTLPCSHDNHSLMSR